MSKHIGSTLDSLLDEMGEREEADLLANKKVLAEKIRRQMSARSISKLELASRMRTSRSQVHRLLDPSDTGVTLGTIARASSALGMKFSVSLDARVATRVRSRGKKARAQ